MGRAAAAAARTEVEVTGAAKAAAAAARVAGAVAATAAVAAVEARVGGGSGRSSGRKRRKRIWQGRPDSRCSSRSPARSPGTGSSCVLRPATSSHSRPARLYPQRATRHQGSGRSHGTGPGLRLLWPGWTRPEAVASTVRPNPPEPHSMQEEMRTIPYWVHARAVMEDVTGYASLRLLRTAAAHAAGADAPPRRVQALP